MSRRDDEREALARELLPLVRRMAKRMKRMVPSVDFDDLIGDGCVGLVRAIDAYDPSRGTTLYLFARHVIAGTMLNGMRRMDPVPERARRTLRAAEDRRFEIGMQTGITPTMAQMAERDATIARAMLALHHAQPLSMDATLPRGERLRANWSDDPGTIVAERFERAALRGSVDRLPQRHRAVMLMHYYDGVSLRNIGIRMAISAQRASQLHVAALRRLRGKVTVASA